MVCVTLLDVAVIRADPAVVLEINETETVPVASGVVTVMVVLSLLNVPRFVVNVTEVPGVTGLPAASVNVAVMREELVPFAGMVMGLAASVIEMGAPPIPT